MLRILGFFLAWIFFMATYYGAVFPGLGRMFNIFDGILLASGPLSDGLLGTLREVIIVWAPLLATAGVIILVLVVATGIRGTSLRP